MCLALNPTLTTTSVCFDMCITAIPILLLKRMMLQSYERTVLMMLFSANILATAILIAGISGIWFTSNPDAFPDSTWLETIYIIMQNLEMLAYTVGASAPGRQFLRAYRLSSIRKANLPSVLYRFLVGQPGSRSSDRAKSWRFLPYKKSDRSNDIALTKGPEPPSYHGNTQSSVFKTPPIYLSAVQDARERDFRTMAPTPAHNDRPTLYTTWEPLAGEP